MIRLPSVSHSYASGCDSTCPKPDSRSSGPGPAEAQRKQRRWRRTTASPPTPVSCRNNPACPSRRDGTVAGVSHVRRKVAAKGTAYRPSISVKLHLAVLLLHQPPLRHELIQVLFLPRRRPPLDPVFIELGSSDGSAQVARPIGHEEHISTTATNSPSAYTPVTLYV